MQRIYFRIRMNQICYVYVDVSLNATYQYMRAIIICCIGLPEDVEAKNFIDLCFITLQNRIRRIDLEKQAKLKMNIDKKREDITLECQQ